MNWLRLAITRSAALTDFTKMLQSSAKRQATLVQLLIKLVQNDIAQQRAYHASNAKDNFVFDRLIPLCRDRILVDVRRKR
jgi:hypothetical protein